jgi:hypothetical protein
MHIKRHWYQSHLATVTVVMLIASVLTWANTRKQERRFATSTVVYYGWPQVAYQKWEGHMEINFYGSTAITPANFKGFTWKGVALNSLYAMIILGVCGTMIELVVRKRARFTNQQ